MIQIPKSTYPLAWPAGVPRTKYRQLMQDAHPDKPGGSVELAATLNRALECAEAELKTP